MKVQILCLVALIGLVCAEKVTYDGYKVYEVTPKNALQGAILKSLENNNNFDFWSEFRQINDPVTVMVKPAAQKAFEASLIAQSIQYHVLIEDVEATHIANTRSQDAKVTLGEVSFTQYLRHAEINAYLEALAAKYPSTVSTVVLGQSYEGRDLMAARISSGGSGKPAIFVDAGIHAREWIAPPVALYIINQLVENATNAALIENVDWIVIPSINPDGYEYCHTDERLWRKTRSPGASCYGTDPNRNFDFHWMETGASSWECSETYGGSAAFSEPETRAVRDYLLANKDTIKLYITFHSYGQYLLYPWGYTSALPSDWRELDALAVDVDSAIASVSGTRYTIGSSTNVLYAAAGGSDDYAKGVAGIELSYTIELPGGGSSGFNPPASRILPVVQETWQGMVVYQKYIEQKFAAKK